MSFGQLPLRVVLAAAIMTMMGSVGGASAQSSQSAGATLNYEKADIQAVARDVANRTKRIFVIDPRLSGQVTIVSPPGATLTPDEVWEVFLATLQVNNFAVVPIGDREYKIIPRQQAIKAGGTGDSGGSTVSRVIRLRHIDARTAAANLRGLLSDNAVVVQIAESNSIVVVDTGDNVNRVLRLLAELDVDDSVVRTIMLENAAASTVANTLLEIVSVQAGDASRVGKLSVVPVDASNSIIVRGSAEEVAKIIPVINQLDSRSGNQMSLDHIILNHADGEDVLPILTSLIENSAGEAGAGFGSKPSVAFHKPTNAIIVNASPDLQRTIRSIIGRLDIRRPQVQIEAIVVEISNTRARELGVQYVSGGDSIPVTAASFTGTSPNIISAAGAAYFLGPGSTGRTETTITGSGDDQVTTTSTVFDTNDPTNSVAGELVEAAIGDLLSLNGFLVGAAQQMDDGSVFGVLLSAIQSDNASNVLAVPSVTMLDNETAFLSVGNEISIVTGETTGSDFDGGFRQIERKDVGNILEVTPQINAGNTVQLKIRLEVSSIGAFSALTDDIITNKSLIETVALAEDGQTLVIGGLIDNDQRATESKVPLLGDIPLVGNLFKGQESSKEESTLMVFIRPTILRDNFTADSVTARKYDYVRQQQIQRLRTDEAPIDRLMQDYIGPGNYLRPDDGYSQPAPMPIPQEGDVE